MSQPLPTAAELLESARAQWTATGDAIERIFVAPGAKVALGNDWPAVDVLRHLADTAHRSVGIIDTLVADGTIAVFPDEEANAAGIAARQGWSVEQVRQDFDRGTEALAARVAQLTSIELSKRVTLLGREWSLAELLGPLLIGHQQAHLAQAGAAAGVE